MSATSDLDVAVRYALSDTPLLFKVTTSSFMNRGVDLSWCSAFPAEAEFVFPPLTYLEPTGRQEQVDLAGGKTLTVFEVVPHIS